MTSGEIMPGSHAKHRAILATVGFSAVGVFCAWVNLTDWRTAAMPLIFYVLLVVNTYFSVRCFSDFPFADARSQKVVDAILVMLYVLLASQFSHVVAFLCVSVALFAVASMKYSLMLRVNEYLGFLRRKIILDILCTLACILALGGVLAGFTWVALPALVVVFVLGNIYVLIFSDIYRPWRPTKREYTDHTANQP